MQTVSFRAQVIQGPPRRSLPSLLWIRNHRGQGLLKIKSKIRIQTQQRLYNEFQKDLPDILAKLALRPKEVQFVEYVKVAMEWLKDRQQSA